MLDTSHKLPHINEAVSTCACVCLDRFYRLPAEIHVENRIIRSAKIPEIMPGLCFMLLRGDEGSYFFSVLVLKYSYWITGKLDCSENTLLKP